MFSWKSQGRQQPPDGNTTPGPTSAPRGGRHALGAPRSEAPIERAASHPSADPADRADAGGRTNAGRMVRFSELQVAVKDGTVYDTAGRPRAVGPLSGARAHVNVSEPDPRRSVLPRALGQKAVTMVIPIEITVTVGGIALTRSKDANASSGGADLIRRVKARAAEFNDLARHWPG